MKKILLFAMAAAMLATGCSKKNGGPYTVKSVLDFEGDAWTALVDNPQYNGPLLYGDGYSWHDPETDLCSELTNSWGDNKFWGGGVAISNYYSTDIETYGTSDYQLTVYGNGAHSGTGCAVCNGYKSSYGDSRSFISFRSSTGVIDHLYICNTTYLLNSAAGNGYAPAVTGDDYVKVVATGYDAFDNETGSTEFYLCNGDTRVTEWTKWSLASLGEVKTVRFDVQGSVDPDLFSQPAYFAIDDITVVHTYLSE